MVPAMDHPDDELQSEVVSEATYDNILPGWVKFPAMLLIPEEKLKEKGPQPVILEIHFYTESESISCNIIFFWIENRCYTLRSFSLQIN